MLCATLVVSLTACGGSTNKGNDATQSPASSGTNGATTVGTSITVNVGSEPDTMDPTLNSAADVATMLQHLFEGLYSLDKDGTPVPAQAEKVEISDDNLTYTFTLRDGLKWSDGTEITADDFVYSWNRAIAKETAADYAYMFEAVAGYADGKLDVTATDAKTLVVKLNAVTPYFLELCAFPAFFPVQKATIEKNAEKWATSTETYVNNGPYTFKTWEHKSKIVLEKNPNYWNVEKIGPQQITFMLMDDDAAILSAYQNQTLLFADSMPNDEIKSLSQGADFYKQGQLGTYYVSYNTQNEYLKNPLVRKALTLAIDRDFICQEIGQSGQVPAGAFVPIGLSDADKTKEFREVGGDYYDPTAAANDANLEAAKQALAEAGYPNGEGLPAFEYLYNEGTGHQQVGEALQNMWAKIGVKVNLVSQEWSTFLQTRKTGDYDIARNGWLGDYNDPISFLDMWTTGGGNNDAQWSNAEYDALIKQIKASADQTERMELMHKAENILFDEWMLNPLYYYVDIYLCNEKLQGVYSSPLGYKYFMYATVAE